MLKPPLEHSGERGTSLLRKFEKATINTTMQVSTLDVS